MNPVVGTVAVLGLALGWCGGVADADPGRKKDRAPVRAVVVEERPDHRAGKGVVATVLVKVTDDGGRLGLKRSGGRAYLEITRETKITRRVGQKAEPAGPGDLRNGVTVEFEFSGVARSEPAIISATAVVVVTTGRAAMDVRIGAVAGLLVGAALCRAADEPKPDLKEYVSKEGKYEVLLPGAVETKTTKIGGTTFTTVTAEAGKGQAFAVGYSDLPGPITAGAAEEVLRDVTEPLKEKGAKVIHDKALTVGPDRSPAREYLIESSAGTFIRQRAVIAGNRMYTISAVGPKDFVTSRVADRVFESFEVTK